MRQLNSSKRGGDYKTNMWNKEVAPGIWEVLDEKYLRGDSVHTHTVLLGENNQWWCDCLGFTHYHRCRHIDHIRGVIDAGKRQTMQQMHE